MEPNKPEENKAPETPPVQPAPPAINPSIKTLRTYAGDMAEAVREQQGSVIKVAIAEEKKRQQEHEALSPTSKVNLILLVSGIGFVLVAALVVWYLETHRHLGPTVEPTTTNETTVLPADQLKTLSATTKEELYRIFQDAGKTEAPEGAITLFTVTNPASNTTLSGQDILNFLEAGVSASFTRSITGPASIGFATHAKTNVPFLLLKINSYDSALIGMLGWERKLLDDLYQLFGISITTDRNYLFESKFQDTIIQNRDARILKDKEGKTVLVYIYLNTSSILLTTDETIIPDILARLNTQR